MLLRSAAARGQRVASVEPRCRAHQKRYATFVHQTLDNGDSYYVPATREERRGPLPKPRLDTLFEMPDLLLELDADGTEGVRPCDQEDKRRMKERWTYDSQRVDVQAHITDLKNQIHEGRRRTADLSWHPMHIWRITPHDILSAAIRGAPPKTHREDHLAGAGSPRSWDEIDPSAAPATSRNIHVENAIPDHALEGDTLFLSWMALRRNQIDSDAREQGPPTPGQFMDALSETFSVAEIRRLVFRYLDAGLDVLAFRAVPGKQDTEGPRAFALALRDACLRAQGYSDPPSSACLEMLTLVGNLSHRLQELNPDLGPILVGLALRLSADGAVLEATSDLFDIGASLNLWTQSSEAAEDVIAAMKGYASLLEAGQSKNLYNVSARRLLFQTLTGLEEDNVLNRSSLRSLVETLSEERGIGLVVNALNLYVEYVRILGHLGAARTLWKEWRDTAPALVKSAQQKMSTSQLSASDFIASAFTSALKSCLHVGAAADRSSPPDLSLAECVTLDYFSMERQNPKTWVGGQRNAPTEGRVTAKLAKQVLDLPLGRYLEAARKLSSLEQGEPKGE